MADRLFCRATFMAPLLSVSVVRRVDIHGRGARAKRAMFVTTAPKLFWIDAIGKG